ncbi:podoplanin isoform X1 [Oryctolagus cuniculus]|uniref:podoplanin isoform X1 n=1 Tax=Oryctolagus cuniculus TaxID=9986 RepID=UPI002231A0A5|nr:podoplanin isoform X1 [Oryctolagus cuniculus]
MWKARILLLLLGSAGLWAPAAAGAVTSLPEDEVVTPGVDGGTGLTGVEDNVVTRGAREDHSEPHGVTALVPTNAESVTSHHFEDHSFLHSTVPAHKESQKPTTPNAATSRSMEKAGEEPDTTIEKGGLATVTLVGIIVGVLLAIGFVGGIVIVVVRKMSGRYSP